ncbi:MAG: hypothetical protein H7330_15555 [Hymenobacteraceae bacterium]|nr:hypothetical protein [Hymenobacteraceae bacterium]
MRYAGPGTYDLEGVGIVNFLTLLAAIGELLVLFTVAMDNGGNRSLVRTGLLVVVGAAALLLQISIFSQIGVVR